MTIPAQRYIDSANDNIAWVNDPANTDTAYSSMWTPEEEDKLLELGPALYHKEFGGRSWNAVRFKYARLQARQSTPPVPEQPLSSPKPQAREEEWEDLFTSLENAEAAREKLSPTDETITVEAPDDKPFGVAFMSDLHIGAGGVDYARLKRDLETIQKTDGLSFLVNGDVWENAKPQMKSGNALYHAAFTSPREQFHYAKTRLGIACQKLLAISQGNHDARDGVVAGIDRLPDLCQHLGTAYFSERGGTIYLTVGGQQYTLVIKHQYMGNSKLSATNSARRLWVEWPHSWDNADVIALAHFHDPHVYQHEQKGRDVVWLRSGAYKIHDEWSESKGFRPSYGVPVVIFFPSEHKMVAFKDFEEGVRYLSWVRT